MMRRIYDISLGMGKQHTDYPGDPAYFRKSVASLEGGDICTLSELRLSAHSGTHIDAPAHFISGGKTIDAYPPARFYVEAKLVEVKEAQVVRPEHIPSGLAPGSALVFKTDNSRSGRIASGFFDSNYVGLSAEAAQHLVNAGLSLVGIDYLSIDPKDATGHPAHLILLSHDVLILESLDLRTVEPGDYTLVCLPLRLEEAEASPVRAVLLEK
jgi:arylformamidase